MKNLLTLLAFTLFLSAFPAQSMKRLREIQDEVPSEDSNILKSILAGPDDILPLILLYSCNEIDIKAPWKAIKRLGNLQLTSKKFEQAANTLFSNVSLIAAFFNIPDIHILALLGKYPEQVIKLCVYHDKKTRNSLRIRDRFKKCPKSYELAGGHDFFGNMQALRSKVCQLVKSEAIISLEYLYFFAHIELEDNLFRVINNADPLEFEDRLNQLITLNGNINTSVKTAENSYILIHYLAIINSHENLKIILSIDPDLINVQDEQGSTALHYAINAGTLESVEILLKNEHVRVNAQNRYGETPLHLASRPTDIRIFQKLFHRKDILVNTPDIRGLTPFHVAALFGGLEWVNEFLGREDIALNQQDRAGNTVLHHTSAQGHLNCVRRILEHPDVQTNLRNINGALPLHSAALNGETECVNALLAANHELIDAQYFPNVKDQDKNYGLYTGLHLAAEFGHYQVCLELLDHDANMHIKNQEGKTARDLAKANGHEVIVELLDSFNP